MKAPRASKRACRFGKSVPRRLLFERLELRHLLATLDFADPGAAVEVIPAGDVAPAAVAIRLQATDLCGRPIDRVSVGDEFWLEAYVQDLRSRPKGVFAAYLDVDYDAALVSTATGEDAGLIFGSSYENGKSGQFESGLIDEAGAFGGMAQLYGGEHLLFAVPFTALVPGVAGFAGNPADLAGHELLAYGSDSAISWDEIRIVGTQVTVEAGSVESGASLDASGGVIDTGWDLACRGAMIAGLGADLASTKPLEQPFDYYRWTSSSPPQSSDSSSTEDGFSGPAFAPAPLTVTGPRDSWTNRRWLDASTDGGPIMINFNLFEPDYAIDGGSWWSMSDRYSSDGWDASYPRIAFVSGSFYDGSAMDRPIFTITFSETVDAGSSGLRLNALIADLPAAATIVPTGFSAPAMNSFVDVLRNDAGSDIFRFGPADADLAAGQWMPRSDARGPSADSIRGTSYQALPLDEVSPDTLDAGGENSILTVLAKRRQAPWEPMDLQLLDAVFAEDAH